MTVVVESVSGSFLPCLRRTTLWIVNPNPGWKLHRSLLIPVLGSTAAFVPKMFPSTMLNLNTITTHDGRHDLSEFLKRLEPKIIHGKRSEPCLSCAYLSNALLTEDCLRAQGDSKELRSMPLEAMLGAKISSKSSAAIHWIIETGKRMDRLNLSVRRAQKRVFRSST